VKNVTQDLLILFKSKEGRKERNRTTNTTKNEGNFLCFPKLQNFVDAFSSSTSVKVERTSVVFGKR
jgi:hypothetical protein